MNSLFDDTFRGLGSREMYMAWVMPDLFPHQPKPRLENWSDEEKEHSCGIYSPERRAELMAAAVAKAAA